LRHGGLLSTTRRIKKLNVWPVFISATIVKELIRNLFRLKRYKTKY